MAPELVLPILETLTPWPEAPAYSVIDLLGIILGIPLAITAVVALIILGPAWYRGRNAEGASGN